MDQMRWVSPDTLASEMIDGDVSWSRHDPLTGRDYFRVCRNATVKEVIFAPSTDIVHVSFGAISELERKITLILNHLEIEG